MKGISAIFGLLSLMILATSAWASKGQAVIVGTRPDSSISGQAILVDTPEGLKVSVRLDGVTPGKHGFHIHEIGSCEDEGKAAGGHYNPEGAMHGFLPKDGQKHAHKGDLGNIAIDSQGSGSLDLLLPGLSLMSGKFTVANRSMILHEKEDDFGQPVGNAGGRIGCGVILVTAV